jgi:diacylglycerol O-acyltransferase
MAIVSGGLRKYLQRHGELPAESLVVNVPVNMRSRGVESEENNQIAALLPALCTDIADPLERLRAIHVSMNEAKKNSSAPRLQSR